MNYSPAYLEHLKQGPFPGQIDPWVENGRYLRQIHPDLLQSFLSQYQDTLLTRGYVAGLDWTLQNGEHTHAHTDIVPKLKLDFDVSVPDLKAIHIRQFSNGDTVTVIEIISPYSKINDTSMQAYTQQRDQWIHEKGTQFVEIDLTRSENRLDKGLLGNPHSYNVSVHLKNAPHVIFMDYRKPLPRIALPLPDEVIAVELQTLYNLAYQQAYVAFHMLNDDFYTESNLPFPSLLSDAQIHEAKEAVAKWREELKRLEIESD